MLMMRLCRWSSRRSLRNKIRQWSERAQVSTKSLSPREAAFVRECNVMVVIRAERSMRIREPKSRRLERAVYEHDDEEGEENKLRVVFIPNVFTKTTAMNSNEYIVSLVGLISASPLSLDEA